MFSREGVQRDLLPLIEGTTVSTKYGMVKSDHVLFYCFWCFSCGQTFRFNCRITRPPTYRVELAAILRLRISCVFD